jgi:hypothetical protein
VNDILGLNKDKTVGLFFINPHVNVESKSAEKDSFWSSILGVVDSIKGIFVSSEMAPNDIEELLSQNAVLLEIDVSDPKLAYVEEAYEVTTVPYLIVV